MIVFKSLGVTATRRGLTEEQKHWTVRWASTNKVNVLHHGDCVGGDDWLANFFSSTGSYIIAHPGSRGGGIYRAHCKANNLIMPWTDFLVRNRLIVNSSDYMLAFPDNSVEQLRSGTWHTIRYAKKQEVAMKIIGPQGEEL